MNKALTSQVQLNKYYSELDSIKLYLDSLPKYDKLGSDDKYTRALSIYYLIKNFRISKERAEEYITDKSDDLDVDAIFYTDENEPIKTITLIQTKYKSSKKNRKNTSIESKGLLNKKMIDALKKTSLNILQNTKEETKNLRLKNHLDKLDQILTDLEHPPVKINCIFVSNGLFNKGQDIAHTSDHDSINYIFYDIRELNDISHVEEAVLNITQKDKSRNPADKIDLYFKNSENMDGIITSTSVTELVKFYDNYGRVKLLEENVRFELKDSSVNRNIRNSIKNNPLDFCFLNNGIYIVCEDYNHELTGNGFSKLTLSKPCIINGGQTTATLYDYSKQPDFFSSDLSKAGVLLRICKTSPSKFKVISHATNSQNKIDSIDLKANDKFQKAIKTKFAFEGVCLIVKKGESLEHYNDSIYNTELIQSYISIYKDNPSLAKNSMGVAFERYFDVIFNDDLNDPKKLDILYKELYISYVFNKFLEGFRKTLSEKDMSIFDHAKYAIMYLMVKIDDQLLNYEYYSRNDIDATLEKAVLESQKIIEDIINFRQGKFGRTLSLANLFKTTDIKVLSDVFYEKRNPSSKIDLLTGVPNI
tara:strand:+ start:402 stop:2168 length:1767 start_codon:yes stop_codon:yes gene_type:complete